MTKREVKLTPIGEPTSIANSQCTSVGKRYDYGAEFDKRLTTEGRRCAAIGGALAVVEAGGIVQLPGTMVVGGESKPNPLASLLGDSLGVARIVVGSNNDSYAFSQAVDAARAALQQRPWQVHVGVNYRVALCS